MEKALHPLKTPSKAALEMALAQALAELTGTYAVVTVEMPTLQESWTGPSDTTTLQLQVRFTPPDTEDGDTAY